MCSKRYPRSRYLLLPGITVAIYRLDDLAVRTGQLRFDVFRPQNRFKDALGARHRISNPPRSRGSSARARDRHEVVPAAWSLREEWRREIRDRSSFSSRPAHDEGHGTAARPASRRFDTGSDRAVERTTHLGGRVVGLEANVIDKGLDALLWRPAPQMEIHGKNDSRRTVHSPHQRAHALFWGAIETPVPKRAAPTTTRCLRSRRAFHMRGDKGGNAQPYRTAGNV